MRVVSVAWRMIRWPVASSGAARGRTERTAVVLEVRTDRDAIGLGEAAPLPGMSRDTPDDAVQAVAALAARVPFDLVDREAASRVATTTTAAPAARFAIETALLDALAREQKIALSSLLRPPTARGFATGPSGHVGAIPSSITAIPHVGALLSRSTPLPSAESSAHVGTFSPTVRSGPELRHAESVPLAAVVDDPETARRAVAAGIRCLKIKVGPAGDVARVLAIADAAPGTPLRIDANRSWPRTEVAARLAALASLPIDFVEEPCRDAHLLLSEPLAGRLALDESLARLTPDELRTALASPALAAVVLKPTLLGGLSATLALADQARRSGVAAIVSHGLEGPIGTAACAELALAIGGPQAAGLAPHPALTNWRVAVAQLAPDHVHPAAAPGLGFEDLDLTRAIAACRTSLGDRSDR